MAKNKRGFYMHLECLIGGLFEHDVTPTDAPVPCDKCMDHIYDARAAMVPLIDQQEIDGAKAATDIYGAHRRRNSHYTPNAPWGVPSEPDEPNEE